MTLQTVVESRVSAARGFAAQAAGAFALGVLAMCAAPAAAHEFWLQPGAYSVAPGKRVAVAIRVGERFAGEPVARKTARIERFEVIPTRSGGKSVTPLLVAGREGAEPAGSFTPQAPGLHTVVFRSNHAQITLEPAKFDDYIKDKGQDAILAERAKRRNSAAAPVREIYSRCAKSLINVRGTVSGAAPQDEPAGLTLEIIADFDPTAAREDAASRFLVLFEGKPLSNSLVTAYCRDPARESRGRTDANGVVVLSIDARGPWLVECMHMRPTPGRNDADYESIWSSLTFEAASAATTKPDSTE